MSFFILPVIPLQTNIDILFNVSYFKLSNQNENTNTLINKTLHSYLKTIKERIESKILVWDQYKKITNPYEYIHSHVPNTTQSICKINPLSRSFFKMIELVNTFDLFSGFPKKCNTFHLAEGPGGFIEATSYLRQSKLDTYYGMTLINENDHHVPGWKKTKHFLNNNPNVIIEKGIDGTGNIMKTANLKYCYEKFNDTIDFITADGGFDFSVDFNNQELISGKLLLSQIAFAIAMQKKGGHFVIKVFDIFKKSSIDMIYLLSMLYTSVYVVKPNTSRYTNSEKYIVCKQFRIQNNEYRNKIILKIMDIMDTFEQNESNFIEKLFDIEIPYYYTNKLEECNAIIGQQQIENIFATLSIIHNKYNNHFSDIKNIHIQKCIGWCKKYKLPYNKITNYNSSYINQFKNTFNSKMNVAGVGAGVGISIGSGISVDTNTEDDDVDANADADADTDVDIDVAGSDDVALALYSPTIYDNEIEEEICIDNEDNEIIEELCQ